MNRIIFIIGMPGAGKTTWGRRFSEAFSLHFTDLDQYIEDRERRSIPDLFADLGEEGFRLRESLALSEVIASASETLVVSCGGGTPLLPANFSLMKASGCIIYLRADLSEIARRLRHQPANRPLLAPDAQSLLSRLEALYAKRRRVYEQADYFIDTAASPVRDFEAILQVCTRQP